MYEEKSYDALSKIVNDWLNGDEDTSSDFGTTRNNNQRSSSSSATTTSSNNVEGKFKSLDDAFADLEDDF